MIKKISAAVIIAAVAVLLWSFTNGLSHLGRIRTLMAIVSTGVFFVTILAIRGYKLREKYAVLWLATAAVIIFAAAFPQLMELPRRWFGMEYATCMVAVVFVFLVLVSFHFSIALSALNDKAAANASRIAILEARIKELEKNDNLQKGKN